MFFLGYLEHQELSGNSIMATHGALRGLLFITVDYWYWFRPQRVPYEVT